MKKTLTTLVLLLTATLCMMAQNQMHVNMKDGTKLNFYLSDIEDITWDYDEIVNPDENDPEEPTVTGDATDITENAATIVGYANNVRDNEATDLKIGIIYCTDGTPNKSNGTQKTVSKSQIGTDGKYSIKLTGLTRGTTYYYRSFVYQSGLWFYGKVRSFSTVGQEVNVQFKTGDATNVTCFSAKLSASVLLTATLSYSTFRYGICYGTTAEPTTKMQVSQKDAEGNYTATLKGLTGNTTYYYRPYAKVDGEMYYGQTSSFKTKEDNVVTTGDADTEGNVRSRLTIGGGAYSQLEVGLCWSVTNAEPTVNDVTKSTNELDDENYYAIRISAWKSGTYYYRAYVKIDGVAHYGVVKSKTFEINNYVNGHEYVDLGLPSGLKWATCNVGASTPEGYGDYFAWGETTPKTTYSWDTYFDSVNGSSSKFKKYYNNGGKTMLEPEDDAATANWGGSWRMPTKAEQDELRNKCTWTWTTQNNVKGYKVKGPNGNSIFLPAAGYRYSGVLDNAGSCCDFWSSSLNTSYSGDAYCLYFSSSFVNWDSYYRYYGLSVRPVCQ